jgi:hypothetical protein
MNMNKCDDPDCLNEKRNRGKKNPYLHMSPDEKLSNRRIREHKIKTQKLRPTDLQK